MAKSDNPFHGTTMGPGEVGVIGISGPPRDRTSRVEVRARLRTEMTALSANPLLSNTTLSKVVECLRFLLDEQR